MENETFITEHTVEGLKRLLKSKENVDFNLTLTKSNVIELLKDIKQLQAAENERLRSRIISINEIINRMINEYCQWKNNCEVGEDNV